MARSGRIGSIGAGAAAVLAALGGVAEVAGFVNVFGNGGAPGGKIEVPEDGARVARTFTARGSVENISRHDHIWLAVEVGNDKFPERKEIPLDMEDDDWRYRVDETAKPGGGPVNLVLLMADSGAHHAIRKWHRKGAKGPLPDTEGLTELDVKTDLRVPAD